MKLHRLVLTNYRGIAHREIDFPDHGVVVVCGANEIGKSSMIEALGPAAGIQGPLDEEGSQAGQAHQQRRRLRGERRNKLRALSFHLPQTVSQEVRDGADDLGAAPRTAHRRRGPRTGQGDAGRDGGQRPVACPAGAAVRVDRRGGSLRLRRAVARARCGGRRHRRRCPATSRCSSNGSTPNMDATSPPPGAPPGEWAAAITRLADAEAAVAECAAAVAEVDERVRRHAVLTEQVAELSQQRIAAGPRFAAAQEAAEKIDELTRQAREAELVAAAAAATSAAAATAHNSRLRLLAEIDIRTAAVAAAEVQAQRSRRCAFGRARRSRGRRRRGRRKPPRPLRTCNAAPNRPGAPSTQLADREEADRLSARLAKIDAIQRDREQVVRSSSAQIAITEQLLRRIETAAAAVDRIGDQLALIVRGGRVHRRRRHRDSPSATNGSRCPQGQTWSMTTTGPTEVEVPGVLTARITPGATTLDVQAKHAAAQEELAAALAAGRVADLAVGSVRRSASPRTAGQPRPAERHPGRPVRRRRDRPTALAARAVAGRAAGRGRPPRGGHRRRARRTRCARGGSPGRDGRMRRPSSERHGRRHPAHRVIYPRNGSPERFGDSTRRAQRGHRPAGPGACVGWR